jgi:hypothetical protein
MGIFSWLRSRRPAGQPERKNSLIRYRYDDPKLEKVERDAAADVAELKADPHYYPDRAHPDKTEI